MLPAKHRLKNKKEFSSVFRGGKTVSSEVLVMKLRLSSEGMTKVGFSVGLKFSKKASRRNKVKRWMREATRENIKRIRPGTQILFLVNSKYPYEKLSYGLICIETEKLLKKAKILQ